MEGYLLVGAFGVLIGMLILGGINAARSLRKERDEEDLIDTIRRESREKVEAAVKRAETAEQKIERAKEQARWLIVSEIVTLRTRSSLDSGKMAEMRRSLEDYLVTVFGKAAAKELVGAGLTSHATAAQGLSIWNLKVGSRREEDE